MFFRAYINTSKEILEQYKGQEPFSSFLKLFFKNNKKFGSRDRKQIAHLCYSFFRLGKSLKKYTVKERLAIAVYLCDIAPSPLLEKINTEWNNTVGHCLDEKIGKVKAEYDFNVVEIFPWHSSLSDQIECDSFIKSFLNQPDVFIRIRPGKEEIVKEKLTKAHIPFQKKIAHCIALAPATRLDEVIEINKEAVIQDLNSQKVIEPLLRVVSEKQELKTAWDCCAASGGKSILLKDQFPNIALTVSDIRESILVNLAKRFSEAGITRYKKMVIDVATASLNEKNKFDLVICDAPCSGSGTWSRTPEQLYFFDEEKIDNYSILQKQIVRNAVKSLNEGGYFLYITCSVFKKENEEVVAFMQEKLSLRLLSDNYFKGYTEKADTLFAALFTL